MTQGESGRVTYVRVKLGQAGFDLREKWTSADFEEKMVACTTFISSHCAYGKTPKIGGGGKHFEFVEFLSSPCTSLKLIVHSIIKVYLANVSGCWRVRMRANVSTVTMGCRPPM